ncbi:MAG: ABC transporter substrate-binding protein, partial [Halanaeroarchaeum sp.]
MDNEVREMSDQHTSSRRRKFLKVTGGTAIAALAGCTSGGDNGGTTTEGGNGGTTTSAKSGSGGPEGPIKIGILAPKDDPVGESEIETAKMVRDSINENGGVDGAKIELNVKDTKIDVQTAKKAHRELTSGWGADATMGIYSSEVFISLLDQIGQSGTIQITTGSVSPRVSQQINKNYDKYKYAFRTCLNSNSYWKSMLNLAENKFNDLGFESAALITEDYAWTKPIHDELSQKLPDIVDVPVTKRIASGTSDWTPIFDEIENAGVDVAYVVLSHIGTTAVLQWAKQERPFAFGGNNTPMETPKSMETTELFRRATSTARRPFSIPKTVP